MRSFLFVTLFILMAQAAHADSSTEAEHLARLAHELELLKPLIEAAESEAKYPARIHFQYAWLKQDLAKVRQGILDHVHPPAQPPRQIAPLAGDYRR